MDDSSSPGEVPADINELVKALNMMRDTLVQVSLLLQDYRFEVDDAERREVGEAVYELLNKTRRVPKRS